MGIFLAVLEPVSARKGIVTIKVDQPAIRTLQWSGEAVTGQENPPLHGARLVSSGFEIDLGEVDLVNIHIQASAYAGLLQDWVVDTTLPITDNLVAHAELRYSPTRCLGLLLLPLLGWSMFWWVRTRPELLRRSRLAEYLQEQNRLDPADDSLLGQVFGGYRLLSRLGSGGAALVFLGEKEEGGERVAVKVFRSQSVEEMQRFRREVEVSRRLQHPNIVQLFDYGDQEGRFYLILELMEGGRLRDLLSGPTPLPRALELLRPLFLATSYAHGMGVVHRDLKPENTMLTKAGVLKIADFGLAKAHDVDTVTQDGVALGSPHYMSPEQIRGSTRNPRLDQYALGCITFEVLMGTVPFEGDDMVQVIYKHLSEDPPPLRPQVSLAIEVVVQRMMAKSPDYRFAGVEDAWKALEKAAGPHVPEEDTQAIPLRE